MIGHVYKYCGYNALGLSAPTAEDLKSNKEYMRKQQSGQQTSEKISSVYATDKFDSANVSFDSEDEEAFAFVNEDIKCPSTTDLISQPGTVRST